MHSRRRSLFVVAPSLIHLLLPGCSISYKTYQYTVQFIPNSLDHVYHQGDHVSLTWTATFDGIRAQPQPDTILIGASIVGPYASLHDGGEGETRLNPPSLQTVTSRTTVVALPPIQTDTWSSHLFRRTLVFPKKMKAGYYIIVQVIQKNSHTFSSGFAPIRVSSSHEEKEKMFWKKR